MSDQNTPTNTLNPIVIELQRIFDQFNDGELIDQPLSQGEAIRRIESLISQAVNKAQKITGDTSDGFHTFNELYEFRMLYNAHLFNEWYANSKYHVHKSRLHSDRTKPFGGGWFVVVAELPTGQITNHYELKDWDLFKVEERTTAIEWDGHTSQDVAKRLRELETPNQVEGEK